MQIENRNGEPITSVDEWKVKAPPASARHWSPHRSACELARAWMEGDAEERLTELLATVFPDVALTRGIAERKTFFDDIPRGPRNHDLLVLGDGLVVGIEAKADESFDKTLAEWVHSDNPASQKPQRVEQLAQAFFGGYDTTLDTLRYQLFSALAGTLADAKAFKAGAAVLVVHEFDTPKAKPTKHALNAADLEAFVERLGPGPRRNVKDGWLSGPFTIPGNAHLPGDVPVYVGKLRTVIV